MQWWCAVQEGVAWEWRWQPYPGVWLFVLLLAGAYVYGVRRPLRAAGESSWKSDLLVGSGIFCLYVALDWPVGPLGAGFLASVHMVQYLLIGIVGPALILFGIPQRAWSRLDDRYGRSLGLRVLTFPVLTLALFIAVAVITHLPSVVDTLMRSQLGSFGIDMAWFVAGLLFWWPVISPVPARPRFPAPLYLVYMFPTMITHTLISVYLVLSPYPVYATYELAPPTGWISAIGDQQVAGCLMWIVGGTIMWSIVGTVVLRWMRAQDDYHGVGDKETMAPAITPPGPRTA